MIASLRASILRGDATATSLAAAAVAAARASPWNDFVRVDEALLLELPAILRSIDEEEVAARRAACARPWP